MYSKAINTPASEALAKVREMLIWYTNRHEHMAGARAREAIRIYLPVLEAALAELAELKSGKDAIIRMLEWHLQEAESALEWRTIDSAPKDGTRILIAWTGDNYPVTSRWLQKAQMWITPFNKPTLPPTHWQLLPTPPSSDQKPEGEK